MRQLSNLSEISSHQSSTTQIATPLLSPHPREARSAARPERIADRERQLGSELALLKEQHRSDVESISTLTTALAEERRAHAKTTHRMKAMRMKLRRGEDRVSKLAVEQSAARTASGRVEQAG